MDLIGALIGYTATAVSVLIYQQKTEKRSLLCKAISDLLWLIHYIAIGGYTGAAISGVTLIRSVVLSYNARRGIKSKNILLLFLVASLVCTALTWKSVYSIFPAIASLTGTVSFWIGKPKILRILSFPISACMMTYGGIYNGSVAVIINESLVMLSSLWGLLVKDRKSKTSVS